MSEIKPLDLSLVKGEKDVPWWKFYDPCKESLAELNRQLAARPEVWGVGLWPDEESEKIAKSLAESLNDTVDVPVPALIPLDSMEAINALDLEWEMVTMLLAEVQGRYGCKIDIKEISARPNMTFGEFVAMVKERKGEAPHEPIDTEQVLKEVGQLRRNIILSHLGWLLVFPAVAVTYVVGMVVLELCGVEGPEITMLLIVWPVLALIYALIAGWSAGVLGVVYRLAYVGVAVAILLKYLERIPIDRIVAFLR